MALPDPLLIAAISEWLEPTGALLLALTLVLACTVAWLSNLVALPGNWLAVLLIAIYAWLGPTDGIFAIGLTMVLVTFVVALVGELIEFAAGAVGARKAGASRKSTMYAIIGSMVGAILGAIVGIPIPVVGSVLAAILFGGVGASAGAMYGEWSDGRPWRENWTIGQATFWGRTFGTLGKFAAGFVILIIVCFAVVL
ncbi:DUF456 domain-containing protein [Roseiconus nitratireducens]|uniref:DUF456 domain-containing protein n=1 Tax=Roseiconus nitratireducens TaxID=2605748 RepID=A0A5M6D1H8_9BACT|nr:DUF456 domain-containing protein [Roseiconus nitratireducens]KAA5539499.1 DUF456 domain-containing protein [Roseiconus nitratireducens]